MSTNPMDAIDEKTKSLLSELSQRTGVGLALEPGQQVEAAKVVSVLEGFLEPYRKNLSLSDFWISLLKGELSPEELEDGMKRFHLREATTAVVFLLCFPSGYDEETVAVLRDLTGEDDWILKPDDMRLALLRTMRNACSRERLREEAAALVDTLSADAMVSVCVSYDECVDSLSDFPASYRKAQFAERCGRQFSPYERVYGYHGLGLGKLVGKLSREDCLEYLNDHLGGFRFDSLDAELSSTIHAFFEEGLSIVNTAKRLFVHRNTLVYRLDKFEKLSGLDLRRFDDAVTASLAMLMETALETE